MPIIGLVEKPLLGETGRGQFTRVGRLNKGAREGFGKGVKLYDLDYFRFTPYMDNPDTARRMSAIFDEVYGEKPEAISPVFIPVNLSGNFDIYDHAWLMAYSFSANRPPIFLGRSDGEFIYQMRATNRVVTRYRTGDLLYSAVTEADEYGNDCLRIGDKLFPWQRRLHFELILPEFNDALHDEKISGFGVVEFTTSSLWDVTTLIAEYNGILGSVADSFHNPFVDGDRERWVNNLPLREIPLRLFRQIAEITRPDPKSDDPLARYKKPTSLCHLQVAPKYSKAMALASEFRSRSWLKITAMEPLLQMQSGAGLTAMDQANRDFFDDTALDQKAIPATTSAGAWRDEYDRFSDVIEGVFDESDEAVTETAVVDTETGEIRAQRNEASATKQAQVPRDNDAQRATNQQERQEEPEDQIAKVVAATDDEASKVAVVTKIEDGSKVFDGKDLAFEPWSLETFNQLASLRVFSSARGVRTFFTRSVALEWEPEMTIPAFCAARFYAENKNDLGQKPAMAEAVKTFDLIVSVLSGVFPDIDDEEE